MDLQNGRQQESECCMGKQGHLTDAAHFVLCLIFYTQPLCRLCTHTSKANLICSYRMADQSPTSAGCTKINETKQFTPKMQQYTVYVLIQHLTHVHIL